MLGERMTLSTGRSKSACEHFVRSFFSTLKEALQNDNIVKIKGFGTFKLVVVNARESININTGQRVSLREYNKITFTPDKVMKDKVNRPFSQFASLALDDEDLIIVEESQKEEQSEKNGPANAPKQQDNPSKAQSTPSEQQDSISEQQAIDSQTEPEIKPTVAETHNGVGNSGNEDDISGKDNVGDTNNDVDTAQANVDSAPTNASSAPTYGNSSPNNVNSITINADSATINTGSATVNADSATINADSATINADSGIVSADDATNDAENDKSEDNNDTDTPTPEPKKRRSFMWVIWVLLILVAGTGCYIIGYSRIFPSKFLEPLITGLQTEVLQSSPTANPHSKPDKNKYKKSGGIKNMNVGIKKNIAIPSASKSVATPVKSDSSHSNPAGVTNVNAQKHSSLSSSSARDNHHSIHSNTNNKQP